VMAAMGLLWSLGGLAMFGRTQRWHWIPTLLLPLAGWLAIVQFAMGLSNGDPGTIRQSMGLTLADQAWTILTWPVLAAAWIELGRVVQGDGDDIGDLSSYPWRLVKGTGRVATALGWYGAAVAVGLQLVVPGIGMGMVFAYVAAAAALEKRGLVLVHAVLALLRGPAGMLLVLAAGMADLTTTYGIMWLLDGTEVVAQSVVMPYAASLPSRILGCVFSGLLWGAAHATLAGYYLHRRANPLIDVGTYPAEPL